MLSLKANFCSFFSMKRKHKSFFSITYLCAVTINVIQHKSNEEMVRITENKFRHKYFYSKMT